MDLYGSVIEIETSLTYMIMYGIVMVEWSRDDLAVPGGEPMAGTPRSSMRISIELSVPALADPGPNGPEPTSV